MNLAAIKNPLRESSRLKANTRMKMEGLQFLKMLEDHSIPICFFDPQYRGILDKMKYGNEGKKRGQARTSLKQMDSSMIVQFIKEIDRILIKSGHLFLWMDKFHLCSGYEDWICKTNLETVDMITWDKDKMGMGYRTRRQSEYLIILQKKPKRVKGIWKMHNIPDVWREKIRDKSHTHSKPVKLQARLIEAISSQGDFVIDPASGSFSVLRACQMTGRTFLGCDIQ